MPFTKDDLHAFHQFAESQLASRGAENLRELVDDWGLAHPPAELHAKNVAAVQAAIRDMQNGDRGRPAERVIEELRSELVGTIDQRQRVPQYLA